MARSISHLFFSTFLCYIIRVVYHQISTQVFSQKLVRPDKLLGRGKDAARPESQHNMTGLEGAPALIHPVAVHCVNMKRSGGVFGLWHMTASSCWLFRNNGCQWSVVNGLSLLRTSTPRCCVSVHLGYDLMAFVTTEGIEKLLSTYVPTFHCGHANARYIFQCLLHTFVKTTLLQSKQVGAG